jgi:hypothetical protein
LMSLRARSSIVATLPFQTFQTFQSFQPFYPLSLILPGVLKLWRNAKKVW